LDIARAIGILGVVTIHATALFLQRISSESLLVLNVFCRYSVPLFVLISGYLVGNAWLQPRHTFISYRNFVKKKFIRLILPYLAFSLCYVLIRVLLENIPQLKGFVPVKYDTVYKIITSVFFVTNNPAGHLYFLPLLFFVSAIFPVITITCGNETALILIVCIAISAISYFLFGDIYSSINPLKGLGFYAIGYGLSKSYGKFHITRFTVLVFLYFGSVIIYLSHIAARYIGITNVLLYALHVCGALLTYYAALYIHESKLSTVLNHTLVYIGRYSFDIYLLHEPYILTVLFLLMFKFSNTNPFLNLVVLIPLAIALPIFLSSSFFRRMKTYNTYFLGNFRPQG
jgi:peptidoglycan/LPS O-acetylase OafA/YrhL